MAEPLNDLPAYYELAFTAGDTVRRVLVLTDQDSEEDTPVNLTGYTVRLQAWDGDAADGGTPVLSAETGGNGITISDAANGEITILLTPEVSNVTPGVYQMAVQTVDTLDEVVTIMTGPCTVDRRRVIP
jgi:hypothetical protein